MKKDILRLVGENNSKGLSLKKLTKLLELEDDRDNVESQVDKLVAKGKLAYDGDKIKLAADNDEVEVVVESKKRKVVEEDATEDTPIKISNAATKPKSLKGLYPDLWKSGEQLWRDNGFDHEYLLQNPDNITRIFCGNLNKNVTEEQLKAHIEDITFIKWITDKDTQQFYGSTFLEMKSAKAAVTAVLKDKQKFLGRYVCIMCWYSVFL